MFRRHLGFVICSSLKENILLLFNASWRSFYASFWSRLSQLVCIYIYFCTSFYFRIQVNLSRLLLKAVSDTSIYMVSLSGRALQWMPTTKSFENSIILLRREGSCWTRQSIPPDSLRYREWPARLSTFSCLPVIWRAHNNRSHTESFQNPVGLCLVSSGTPTPNTHADTHFIAPPCLPSHLSSALCCSPQASPLDLDLMKPENWLGAL